MIIAVQFSINNKHYYGYIDNEAIFDKRPLLEKAEALSLMNDINSTFAGNAEMVYNESHDYFYDDYRGDKNRGDDYETEDGIKHLYDFAEDYFEDWEGMPRNFTIYKDMNGTTYELGEVGEYYEMVVLKDKGNNRYVATHNAKYMTAKEFAELTKIDIKL